MRALIVDDSSAMRAILGMTLKRQGFEMVQAKDGMDALAVLENRTARPDSDRLEHAGDEWIAIAGAHPPAT
jgi:DNA-binding response OmpR family regulator